jgi:predicted transcriptional regulator
MTAEIIQSQITSKQMSTEEIKAALNETFQALKSLQDAEAGGMLETETEATATVMDPKKSIQKNKIICLECGQEFKMLSPKHLRSHSLTSKEYRKKHGLSARQPLCAKALSERRSQSGKERGLPDNLRKAIVARTKKKSPRNEMIGTPSSWIHFRERVYRFVGLPCPTSQSIPPIPPSTPNCKGRPLSIYTSAIT